MAAGCTCSTGAPTGPLIVQQDHNVFRGNAVVASGTASSQYFGGGEADFGATLKTSTDDSFIGNTLPGPAGSTAFSQGAGLAITDENCGGSGTPITSTAINLDRCRQHDRRVECRRDRRRAPACLRAAGSEHRGPLDHSRSSTPP